ncbi:MAG: hypothetical protein LBI87_10190, partial [Candidatus Accumulibacter sp.]|nr:hypothetical protein [Accumulibacter sp.]
HDEIRRDRRLSDATAHAVGAKIFSGHNRSCSSQTGQCTEISRAGSKTIAPARSAARIRLPQEHGVAPKT